jgi:hypothetical protein
MNKRDRNGVDKVNKKILPTKDTKTIIIVNCINLTKQLTWNINNKDAIKRITKDLNWYLIELLKY